MPFFSVVIPSYNRADLIGATLDSVLEQSMDDLEIIVVDDGSTDDSLELLRGYAERAGEKLKVIEQSNAGPGAARNAGIAAASGQYVAFLDSDDLWFGWTAALYRRVLESENFPAFLAGTPQIFEKAEQIRSLRSEPPTPSALKSESFSDYFASGEEWRWYSASSFVVRRDVLEDGVAFTSLPINGEDIDFSLQLGTAPGFVDVQSPPTFAYRKHAGSAMSNSARTLSGTRNLLRSERAGLYPGGAERADERQRMITRHVRPVCLECRRNGQRGAARQLYRATLDWHLKQKRTRFLAGFWLQRAENGKQFRADTIMSDAQINLLRRLPATLKMRARIAVLKAAGAHIGANCWIQNVQLPRNPWDIELAEGAALDNDVVLLSTGDRASKPRIRIGHNCYINRFSFIDASESIEIGDNSMIGPNCYITDHDHDHLAGVLISHQELNSAPVTLGNDVWLGAGVIVLKGVTIGDGAIIGAGSVITKDVAPGAKVVGVPGRSIGQRA